jgi:hypothetical protein
MVTGHEIEALRNARLAELLQTLRSRWFSGREMLIGAAWAVFLVLASVGGLVDTLHG